MDTSTNLIDTSLLPGNLGDCFPENGDVVNAKGGDAGNDWLRNDIGTVKSSADTDLEYCCVNLLNFSCLLT